VPPQRTASDSRSLHDFIVVKADKRLDKINFEDIVYFNSIGDYLKIFMKTGKVIITNER
jgi:DNA-binding LytR/AlgR family response regulator